MIKIYDLFHIFAPNIDCLDEVVLMSTHNLCFGAEIRKIMTRRMAEQTHSSIFLLKRRAPFLPADEY